VSDQQKLPEQGLKADMQGKSGAPGKVIFAHLTLLVLSGILTWVFGHSMTLSFHQSMLIVGPGSVREHSAMALADCGQAAVPALIRALKDEELSVRNKAGFALGQIGKKASAAIPALKKCLKDPSVNVCANAKDALAHITKK
jgi:HEAT repeat protein